MFISFPMYKKLKYCFLISTMKKCFQWSEFMMSLLAEITAFEKATPPPRKGTMVRCVAKLVAGWASWPLHSKVFLGRWNAISLSGRRRKPFRFGLQTRTGGVDLQRTWILGRPRRRSFWWPQRSSGRGKKGKQHWLRLWTAVEEICWPWQGTWSGVGNNTLRNFWNQLTCPQWRVGWLQWWPGYQFDPRLLPEISSKCPEARQWTSNCFVLCMAAFIISVWMYVWMGEWDNIKALLVPLKWKVEFLPL